ncbi:MAG TPA: M4 family metallopeptidase [Aldersonia sp.]
MIRSFVPPYVLERIAASEEPRLTAAPRVASATLRRDAVLRDIRAAAPIAAVAAPGLTRTISDARHTHELPGVVVRREGDLPTGDVAADEAYNGFGATYALFEQVYGRDSVDGRGGALDGTVHFGVEYDNAFWDGQRMVFGDGDGEVFRGFTGSLTVIGHELTHGVVQHTANLAYQGQAGALNESIADVFGVLVEQYQRRQTAAEASWLVGEGLFMPDVQASRCGR